MRKTKCVYILTEYCFIYSFSEKHGKYFHVWKKVSEDFCKSLKEAKMLLSVCMKVDRKCHCVGNFKYTIKPKEVK